MAFALNLSRSGPLSPVFAFATGRDAHSSARGFFLLKRGSGGHNPLICKEMAENKAIFHAFAVNKL